MLGLIAARLVHLSAVCPAKTTTGDVQTRLESINIRQKELKSDKMQILLNRHAKYVSVLFLSTFLAAETIPAY